MLEKIQEISTKLDKKRVYTAVGALVVALATGHVMQRNVGDQTVRVDMPSQQQVSTASVMGTPPASSTAPQPVQASDSVQSDAQQQAALEADTPNMDGAEAPGEEVTRADVSASIVGDGAEAVPADDRVAETAETEQPERDLQIAGLPEDIKLDIPVSASAPETPETTSEAMDLGQTELPADLPVELANVTRAVTNPEFAPQTDMIDIAPAAGAPTPRDDAVTATGCAPNVRATARAGAMVDLTVLSSCNPGAEVDIDHVGLRFTEKLNEDGVLDLSVPAMTSEARIEVSVAGQTLSADVTVPDMAEYDRVALVWQGGTGLQLHALEGGAFYGDAGHRWAESPAMPDHAIKGEGGFVTVLGSTSGGFAADVYTYPVSMPTAPAISIEAQVLETTCEDAIMGEYLRSSVDTDPVITEVGMVVPECGAVGEYLVLKNLPEDLTIARN